MNLVWQRLLGRCQRYIWWLGACPSSSVAAPAPGAAMATSAPSIDGSCPCGVFTTHSGYVFVVSAIGSCNIRSTKGLELQRTA